MSTNDDTRDELVSAVLDGEATDEEVAAVRADPALATRLDELAAVRARLATDAPVPPAGAADAAIAAALDAAATQPPAPVVSHPRWRRAAPALAAAAALLVVLFGVLALTRSTQSPKSASTAAGTIDGSDASTTTGPGAPAAAEDAAQNQYRAPDNGLAAPSAGLGSFTDAAGLIDAARRAAEPISSQTARTNDSPSAPLASSAAPAQAPLTCAPPRGDPTLVLNSTAELEGRPVRVFVYTEAQGLPVIVVDAATCAPVLTVTP